MKNRKDKTLLIIQAAVFLIVNGGFFTLMLTRGGNAVVEVLFGYFFSHVLLTVIFGVLLMTGDYSLENRILYPLLFSGLLVIFEIVWAFYFLPHLELGFKLLTLAAFLGMPVSMLLCEKKKLSPSSASTIIMVSSILMVILPLVYVIILFTNVGISLFVPFIVAGILILGKALWFILLRNKENPFQRYYSLVYMVDLVLMFFLAFIYNFVYLGVF
jgi:hypothetical protein